MTYTLLNRMQTPAGAVSQEISASGLAEAQIEGETVPLATDTLMNIAFPYATIKAYIILATVACTIETNSSNASGGQSISVSANVPITWIEGGQGSNVFSVDVTKIYVTAASAGLLTIKVLYDPTA